MSRTVRSFQLRLAQAGLLRLGVILVLTLGVTACASLRGGPDDPPAPGSLLGRADTLFETGEYAAAAELYRETLIDRPDQRRADRILFRLGVIHLLPESRERERDLGRGYLDQLIVHHPDSPWAEPAHLLLRLDAEIGRLTARSRQQQQTIRELEERLEALKQIDLEHSSEPPLR